MVETGSEAVFDRIRSIVVRTDNQRIQYKKDGYRQRNVRQFLQSA